MLVSCILIYNFLIYTPFDIEPFPYLLGSRNEAIIGLQKTYYAIKLVIIGLIVRRNKRKETIHSGERE